MLSAATPLDWQKLSVRDVNILYHQNDEKIVKQLSESILNDIDIFQKSISFYPDIEARIVIAPDDKYYNDLVSGYGGVIEFSEAFYSGRERTIYIRNPRDLKDFSSLRVIILHEYIHLFIDSLLDEVPLWFHEGMAVFFSEGVSFDREIAFARDFLLGNTRPLSGMVENYPPNRVQWLPFYTKSALAVKYLYSSHRDEFYLFWEMTDAENNFRRIFTESFAMTPEMFSVQFDEYLSRKYKIEILLSFTGFIWAMFPLFLLIAWVKKRIKAYKIQKRWNREIDRQDKGELTL